MALVWSVCATAAAAQTERPTAITAMGGAGAQGTGSIAACCGPFQPDVERLTLWWVGGSISRDVRDRFAVDGEVTWDRLPRYTAYVQGTFAGAPYQGYASRNEISSVTLAGLLRWHAWRAPGGGVDLVAGPSAVRQRRVSHLASVAFRPGPTVSPMISLDVAGNRTVGGAVVGVDVERARGAFSVVAHGRVHLLLTRDTDRTDLDVARHIWRGGGGARPPGPPGAHARVRF
jgi:hypothetical protein